MNPPLFRLFSVLIPHFFNIFVEKRYKVFNFYQINKP